MKRVLALGSLAAIAAADITLHRRKPPWIAIGLFDHPAHLATAALVALNLDRRSRRWTLGLMVGSLLPDADHVPHAINYKDRTADDPRPVTHCLLAVAPVAAAAALTQSDRLSGATVGMLAHFGRDVAVGSGVALLWPATRRPLKVPYAVYAGACTALAFRALVPPKSASLHEGL
jgi:membrane-bound metal-dependent hydrolase YbcI (DUF457 family)